MMHRCKVTFCAKTRPGLVVIPLAPLVASGGVRLTEATSNCGGEGCARNPAHIERTSAANVGRGGRPIPWRAAELFRIAMRPFCLDAAERFPAPPRWYINSP